MAFRLDIPVRYGEVDMQGVVFNAHYLAYVDDCIDRWLRTIDEHFEDLGWEVVVKKATVEWSGSAGIGDVLTLVPSVARWGRTSFDVVVDGAVGERPVFQATVVYISVQTGTKEPVPTPEAVRAALSA